jgi:hypothetical protein
MFNSYDDRSAMRMRWTPDAPPSRATVISDHVLVLCPQNTHVNVFLDPEEPGDGFVVEDELSH